jgi:hypothetical protein
MESKKGKNAVGYPCFRSYCRYGNVTVVGPKECGKRTLVEFCAHYLGVDLVSKALQKEDIFVFRSFAKCEPSPVS